MKPSQIITVVVIVAAFGVLVPMFKGLDFLDLRIIVAYALLSAVIAAASVADAFSSSGGGGAFGRMLRVWLYSWGIALLMLVVAFLTLRVKTGYLPLPRTKFLLACEAISATSALAVVALGALLTRKFSPKTAKTVFRTLFLVTILGLVVADRYGVETPTTDAATGWLFVASGVCLVVAVILASRYPRTE